MNRILFLFVFVFITSANLSQTADSIISLGSTQIFSEENYVFRTDLMSKLPEKGIDNIIRFFPGVISYHNNYYLRGSRNNEIGYFVDGVQINDLFTWQNSFQLSPQSLEEIILYPGYVPTDYGNISSGLFGFRLKTGGEQFYFNIENTSDNISFSNDPFGGNERLGTYWYGYNEINANMGGPLFTDEIRFFVDVNYLFKRDRNPQKYSGVDNFFAYDQLNGDSIRINLPKGIVPGNSLDNYNLTSTLLFDFDNLSIKTSGIYSFQKKDAERLHIQEYLNHRYGQVENRAGLFSANITHVFNENISYELTGSYFFRNEETFDPYLKDNYWDYGDSVANANVGFIWTKSGPDIRHNNFGRYTTPHSYVVYSFPFKRDGVPSVNYSKSEQQKMYLKGLLRLNFFKFHNIYVGGEYVSELVRQWKTLNQLSLQRTYNTLLPYFPDKNEEEIKNEVMKMQGVNNFGYDLLGRHTNSGVYAPPKPKTFSFFINDDCTLENSVILKAGLRYEYRDYNYRKFIDPSLPDKTIEHLTMELKEDGLAKTENYSFWLPRFSLYYKHSNNFSISVGYSKNVQSHSYNEMFQGLIYQGYLIRGHGIIPLLPGDLKPLENSISEFSADYYPTKNILLRLNYFYKEIKNQPSLDNQQTDVWSSYANYFVQKGEATTLVNGADLIFELRDKRFEIFSSLSYQNSRSTFSVHNLNIFYRNFIQYSAPNNNSNAINFKSFAYYNFYDIKKFISLFENTNLSLMYTYNSGHPFTLIEFYFGAERNISFVEPIGKINAQTTPSVSQFDLKLEKNISLFDKLNVGIYLMVINFFDSRNVYDVFRTTGSPDYDGYITNPQLYKEPVEAYGEKYLDLYKMTLQYNPKDWQQYLYGPPRQIYLGIKLNY